MNRGDRSRFGNLLLEMRLVDEASLDGALAEQRSTGQRLARVLSDRGLVDEERLTKVVASKLGLETLALDAVRIHPRVLARLPAELARSRGVLPYAVKRGEDGAEVMYLAMADPLDTSAILDVQRHTGCKVKILVAGATALDAALQDCYPIPGVPRRSSSSRGRRPDPREATLLDDPQVGLSPEVTLPEMPSLSNELPPFMPSTPADRQSTVWDMPSAEVSARPVPELPLDRPALQAQPHGQPFLALEVPVPVEEGSHPFQGPSPSEVPVGLGETAIIPDVSLRREPFHPPPPPQLEPVSPEARLGFGARDIPGSEAEVLARGTESEPDAMSDDIEEIEEIHLDPLEDEVEIVAEAPRDAKAEDVRAALGAAAAPRAPTPDPEGQTLDVLTSVVDPEAERLVEALESGASLNAPDRARLVLALGRILLRAGVLPRAELLRELSK